jgi:hypothetical protein
MERNHISVSVPVPTQGLTIKITNYDTRWHKIRGAKTNVKSIAMIYGNI